MVSVFSSRTSTRVCKRVLTGGSFCTMSCFVSRQWNQLIELTTHSQQDNRMGNRKFIINGRRLWNGDRRGMNSPCPSQTADNFSTIFFTPHLPTCLTTINNNKITNLLATSIRALHVSFLPPGVNLERVGLRSGLRTRLDYRSSGIFSIKREHPSALSSFNRMINVAKGKQIIVFLDYDGTLSPIVSDPECAFMSDQMRKAVRDVSNCFPTAIISGRSRKKVYDFVKLDRVYYSGSHGMDTAGPALKNNSYDKNYQQRSFDNQGNEFIVFQPAQDFLPAVNKLLIEVTKRTQNIKGVAIEDNRFCLSVHYRHVKDEDYKRLEDEIKLILSNNQDFYMTKGNKVLEIRPSIKWNKGDALKYLLETFGFHKSSDVFPIYIGDDRTDEDAFMVLRERGEGYPIIVSSTPRETMALHSLRNPSEVQSFLTRLSRWGFENSTVVHQ